MVLSSETFHLGPWVLSTSSALTEGLPWEQLDDGWKRWAVSAAILLISVLVWRRYLSPISDVPGPFWASVTRLWHVKYIVRGDQNLELARLHEKHGHFVRMAPDEVSVSHPEGIKKLLLAPLHKGVFYKFTSYPDWRFQTPMSSTDPKVKIERSKHFASGYSATNVLQYEAALDGVITKLLGWLDSHASGSPRGGEKEKQPMDLDKFLTYAAFDVVGEVMFSRPFGFLDAGEDVGGAITTNLALESVGTWVSQFRWMHLLIGNPFVTWLGLSPGSMLFRTTMEALAEREENPDARFDIAAHWLRALRPAGKDSDDSDKRMTMRDIHAQATTNVGAGSDTVSCALQSTLYHMIRRPETWRRARAEIDEVARREGRCMDAVVSVSDAQKSLPYLQACFKEALRIHSPVPMGLPRLAPKGGVTIGERTFPEGTTVTVSPWVMHRSKEIWGEDADEFRPERWLGKDASRLEKYFIPFGCGYMSCPGQHIARMELSKICATIIRDYDIELADPGKEWEWMAYFTMVPKSWPVLVSKRQN